MYHYLLVFKQPSLVCLFKIEVNMPLKIPSYALNGYPALIRLKKRKRKERKKSATEKYRTIRLVHHKLRWV